MSDEPQRVDAANDTPDAAAPRARRAPGVRRLAVWLLAVLLAITAGLMVVFLTVDLGPSLRELAEREASKYLERQMHIGKLKAKLTPGVFVIEDVLIEGLEPDSRPFLKAKQITVELPWWTIFSRRLMIESIWMTDWEMYVETFPSSVKFPNGRHNMPRFVRPRKEASRPLPFTTTLKSVVASRGSFTYEDHGTPWSTTSRNLTVQLYRSQATNDYRGRASFSDGTVSIQQYEPFSTAMQARFNLQGRVVHFDRIDLRSDGAQSVVTGDVDLGRWPEQTYQVRSRIQFPSQKEIFFKGDAFTVSGEGDFEGTFHLFRGGRELKGTFRSDVAGVNEWRFPNLRGSVLWLPDSLEITDATADVYGGRARFGFRMGPFGEPEPARAVWDVVYRNVDLVRLTNFLETEGLRLSGSASGTSRLEWPLGRWARKSGSGELTVQPPAGLQPMTRELPVDRLEDLRQQPAETGPFNPHASLGYLPVAGRIRYEVGPEWILLRDSWAATERTYVGFEGLTAYGERSRIPFQVTSLDWQESSRVLAGIITLFGSPTGAVEIGGHGEFNGVMVGAFARPRVQGTFRGDDLRAFDVVWGSGQADVVIENNYAFVSNSRVTSGGSEIRADGQFSLGYPRRDGGEEIDARVRITRRPLADLRHAFELDDYSVDGLLSGEFHVFHAYERPQGFGRMTIEKGVAYGETFETATSAVRLEGIGIRLDNLAIAKQTGRVSGAAWVGWDGTYSFNADGRQIPLESLDTITFPRAPLSGMLQFTASGAGSFEAPRYDVKLRIDDLFAGDEGIGQVNGRLGLLDELLSLDFEAASPRLVVSGSGRIALTPEMDAEITLRFADTSLDPYVRFFEPRLSPFTQAIVGGTVRAVGELRNPDHLVVSTRVEQLDLKLFDYQLRNACPGAAAAQQACPIELTLDRNVLRVDQFNLAGEGTQLQVQGDVSIGENRMAITASGDANLGILQGFFRDIRSRGVAAVKAQITGALERPVFSGSASITDGRLRHFSLPHSLEFINGTLTFDAAGIRVDDVTGRLGGGEVTFGGRIGLVGFTPGELSLTARGERMNVRYPEGFRSNVDADLSLQGTMAAPLLTGKVIVNDAVWSRRIEANPDIFNLGGGGSAAPVATAAPAATIPLRFDVAIEGQESLRIDNNLANMVASADLRLQGTYDRPLLFGRAEIERGDFIFEGNRYIVTQGSFDFYNPSRIEPFFDLEAETRVRLPGQTYRVTVGLSGTPSRMAPPVLNSDPPLPMVNIIALLFGQTAGLDDAELRALRPEAAQQSEEALLRQGMARLLTSPVSTPFGRVFEEAVGASVQITPNLGSETDLLTPSARVVIGKRISNRAYLTFARALGNVSREQILILEYDQSDRVGWVLTQNGDGTFAIDFRVRHRF